MGGNSRNDPLHDLLETARAVQAGEVLACFLAVSVQELKRAYYVARPEARARIVGKLTEVLVPLTR